MHPLLATWWRLFINRTDGALRWQNQSWRYTPQPLTELELDRALAGRARLGTYATDAAGLSRWLCLDADTSQGRDALIDLAQTLDPESSLLELSRRGAHLWRFSPPTPWTQARAYGELLVYRAGVPCEVFPKGPGRTGVRFPATSHPRTEEIYPLLDPATGAIREVADLQRLIAKPLPPMPQRSAFSFSPTEVYGSGAFDRLRREVEQFTRLRQYGPDRAIGRCPFHDDRHPSLSLLGGFWRCWAGCGEGGVGAWRRLVQRHERR